MGSLYRRHRFPPEIISHAVWLYHRFALSFRDVEDLLAERGITVSYEAIRSWCRKFGPAYARALRRRQGRLGDIWHVDEVFITIRGERHYPWRAVDQDDDVLDILVTRHSDRKAAKRFFRKVLKHQERRRCNLLPTSCEATRLRTERSSHPLHIEPGNTKTTELKSPTSTPGSRNAKCADSSQRHTLNDFSRSHGPIHNLFRVARHHLKAIHHRLLRERAFTGLEDVDVCLLKGRNPRRTSGQNRPRAVNLTMPCPGKTTPQKPREAILPPAARVVRRSVTVAACGEWVNRRAAGTTFPGSLRPQPRDP